MRFNDAYLPTSLVPQVQTMHLQIAIARFLIFFLFFNERNVLLYINQFSPHFTLRIEISKHLKSIRRLIKILPLTSLPLN